MASGTLTESLRETLAVFEAVDGSGEPLTTNEVADRLPISRRSTYARLERLADDDYLGTKKVGSRGRVWWRLPASRRDSSSESGGSESSAGPADIELSRLIDNTPGMVYRCVNEPTWPMTFVSDACTDITGYDAAAVESGDVSWGEDVIHPDDRDRVVGEITAQLDRSSQFTIQYRVVTADGDVRWVSERGNAVTRGEDGREFLEGVVTDVTDQQNVEQELAERERQLQKEKAFAETVLDNQRDLIYAVDPDGQFTRWNDRVVEVTGYTDEEIAEMHVTEFIADDAAADAVDAVDGVIQEGESATLELPLVTADGTEIPYEFTGTPIRGENGDVVGLAGVGRDVTERKERERQLTRHRDDLESELEEIYGRITDAFFAMDADWNFTHVNDRTRELVDPEGNGLVGESLWEVFPDTVDSTFETEYRSAMETQEPTTFEAYYSPLDTWFEVHAYPSESGLSVYFSDVTDRKESEQELELYETIVETIDDGVYVLDEDFHFSQVNDAYVEMTGYSREELLGSHCSLVVDQAVLEQSADDLQQIIDGKESGAALEAEIHRKDGSRLPAESRFTALPSLGDESPRKAGVVRDISNRKERERELEQYETVAETAADVIITIDDESRIQSVNPAVEDIFGYTPEELVGESLTILMDDQLAGNHREGVVEYLQTGDPQFDWDYVELPGIDADGDQVPLAVSFSEYEHGGEHYFTGILRDITGRKQREDELVRQREQLAALNDINEVVHEITDAAIEQSTRAEIESVVCERLASTDSYRFAWIGDADANSQRITPRAKAGTEGYLDEVTVSVDPNDEYSGGPTGKAFQTGEMQTSQDVYDDPQYEPWRDSAETYDFRSSAAIPITYGGTVYGVLNVYADRQDAFEGQERDVVGQLGEVVGHAIAAVERKRALMSDEVVELRFHIPNLFESLDVDTGTTGRITLDETIPIEDGEYLVYGHATEDAIEGVQGIVDTVPHWESVRFHEDDGDTTFEARLSDPPVLSALASLGGSVERSVIEDGDFAMTLHLAPSADTRQLVDVVRDAYPTAEMVARRQAERPGDGAEQLDHVFAEALTDRQRASLQAAYHAGFFEWPREASGEDVAESLDVAAPTFHQHLRKAEKQIFESLLSSSM